MTNTHLVDADAPMLIPIADHERIATLDILRAVALLGVFLINMEYFTRPLETYAYGMEPGLSGVNYAIAWTEHVFMLGNFWTMFALLFGMGFAVMLERAERAGRSFLVTYLRRTAALLMFGVAHAVLIWSGDILHSYALAACLLLLILRGRWWWLLLPAAALLAIQLMHGPARVAFGGTVIFVLFAGANAVLQADRSNPGRWMRRLRICLPYSMLLIAAAFGLHWRQTNEFFSSAGMVSFAALAGATAFVRGDALTRLWRVGALFYLFVPLVVSAITLLGMVEPGPITATEQAAIAKSLAEQQAMVEQAATINAAGSYAQNVSLRAEFVLRELPREIFLMVGALGMFLLGVWFIRSGAMRDPRAHSTLFRRMAWVGLPCGLILTLTAAAVSTSFDPKQREVFTIAVQLAHVANLALCLGVVGGLMLFIHSRDDSLRLQWLAPAGRMALSNYLLQSIIGTLIFYGYGLGQWGRIDRLGQLALVLTIFATQVLLSRWWLERFRFGPTEWLWRAITYAQRPPFRRKSAGRSALAPAGDGVR